MGRLGGPNRLGDLVVPELLRGPPGGRCGRIGEEGSVDGHLFPVSVGVRSPETQSVSWKGAPKWGILLYGSSFMGTWRGGPFPGALKVMKEGSGDGHISSWGLSCATWSGHLYWGLCDMVERGSRGGASHSVGAL